MQLDQRRSKVIGITPDDLVVPDLSDVEQAIWLPLDMDENLEPKTFGGFTSRVKGLTRLAPTASYEQSFEEIDRLNTEAAALYHPPDISKSFNLSTRMNDIATAAS